jgi:arsenate reductase
MTITLYHNPNCSKSRAALALLTEQGCTFDIRNYLEDPLDDTELEALLLLLGIEPIELLRQKEDLLSQLAIDPLVLSYQQLVKLMADYPTLIERPIVADNIQAVIGRPTERIARLLPARP